MGANPPRGWHPRNGRFPCIAAMPINPGINAMCQSATYAVQQNKQLFDHLIGNR
jgi:hypothetical protein